MQRRFTSIYEPIADFKWQKLFWERWPAYKEWIQSSSPFTDAKTSMAALKRYMPEMVDTHDHLCRLVGADDLVSSFLTGFQPPTYYSACSQAVSTVGSVQLVRNYDYHVERFESTLLMTAWNGKRVIASSDCLIGVLDGMNEDGLAVSLTFGGRRIVGFGFGIPFVLRYILEFCSTVEEAVQVLHGVPSHMSYNVTMTDKSGQIRTVQLAPDRTAVVTETPFATNHQGAIEWAENAGFNKTAERAVYLEDILYKGVGGDELTNAFLQPPLYNTQFSEGLGTLYTAVYLPIEGIVQLHWPNEIVTQSFFGFSEEDRLIKFNEAPTYLV
jgi:predicted choloylglycine hydrolase